MKIFIFIAIFIIFAGGAFFLTRQNTKEVSVPPVPLSTPSPANEGVNITASFTIVTDKITRSFVNPKYHNQSSDVYITSENPSIVYVKKAGITWDDFFKTLPMKLTKECLITGDGETLCDGRRGTLKFYLNGIEDKNLLDKQIQQNDEILIKFTSF